MRDKNEPPPPSCSSSFLSLSLSVSQCHSVPHFKLPLLGSGHKNRLCSTCQMWDTKEPSLVSSLCSFHFSLVLSVYLEIILNLNSTAVVVLSFHFSTSSPPRFSFVCIESSSYPNICIFTELAHSQINTPFKRQCQIQVQFVIVILREV